MRKSKPIENKTGARGAAPVAPWLALIVDGVIATLSKHGPLCTADIFEAMPIACQRSAVVKALSLLLDPPDGSPRQAHISGWVRESGTSAKKHLRRLYAIGKAPDAPKPPPLPKKPPIRKPVRKPVPIDIKVSRHEERSEARMANLWARERRAGLEQAMRFVETAKAKGVATPWDALLLAGCSTRSPRGGRRSLIGAVE